MLFCMLFGEYPFYGTDEEDLIHNIIEQELRLPKIMPQGVTGVTDHCKDLLKRMLAKKPEQRITMYEIETHTWFKLE
jgi:serine/threonine protein kinase